MFIQTLIENVSDSVFIIDDNMLFVEANGPACAFLNCSRDDIIGKPAWTLVTDFGREKIYEYWEQLQAQGTLEARVPVALEDGRILQVKFKAIANVSPNRHLILFRDTTGLKRFEAQTQAFLKLGRQLSAATTAETAARIIANVADELLGWDACFLDLYLPETNTVDPLLTVDTVDGKRQDVPPANKGAPSQVSRRTIEEGKQLILREVLEPDNRLVPFGDVVRQSASLMFVPVRNGDQIIGVFSIQSYNPNAYDQEDLDTLQALADYGGGALHRIWQAGKFSELMDETRRRAEQMEVMVNISSAMRHIQSRQELIPIILTRLMALSGAAGAAIALRSGDYLVFELSLGHWPQLAEAHFPADQGITGNVLATGQPFVSADLGRESEFSGLRVFDEVFGAICVPLGTEENSVGVLWLVRHESFSAEEQRVMVTVGDIVGNALRRTILYERVQEQARQVQQIVDTVPEGMLLLNEDRTIVLANPVAQTYLIQLAGVTIGDKLTELSGRPLDKLLRPIMAGENWHELVVEKTGQLFELAVQKTYGRLEGGWVLVLRDVTEERNQARYFQIQERLAVVGQLAAGIAHDFNNIMSVIILYSTMLRHSENLTEKEKERLVIIHRQADRASELIRQILDFSRQSVMKRNALNLVPFLKELVNLLERTLPETIRLELETDPGDLIIQGDPTRLQQAVMNLAVNARDAMPDGGTLHITVRSKEVRPKDVPPLPDMAPGAWFELKIEDTGMGIKSRDLPHLFEPFFTTKREGEGTGLGLAQVYGIVKQHDGYIDVSSRLRQGTTFYIYLPRVQMPKVEDVKPETTPLPEGMGYTILVVEDDHSARRALAEVLRMMDYEVVTANNGQEALQYFDELNGKIDLVLSDLVMPTMGGAALYAQLKKKRPDIKMVVMTGYPKKEEDWDLLEDGVVYWVQKPFKVSTIVETIKKALLQETG